MTEQQMAQRAREAIQVGTDGFELLDKDTAASDLITNVFHYCAEQKLDIDEVLRRARNHFESEFNPTLSGL